MKQKIDKEKQLRKSYRITEDMLQSIEKIVRKNNEKARITYEIVCKGSLCFSFDSIDEMFQKKLLVQDRIVRLGIFVTLPINNIKYEENEIVLTFDNSMQSSVFYNNRIRYSFIEVEQYYFFEQTIEKLLCNYECMYSFFSYLPILSVLGLFSYVCICIYTKLNSIVFNNVIQILITLTMVFCMFSPIYEIKYLVELKRNLFPYVEFRLGTNIEVENKWSLLRNFILGTVTLGIIIGLLTNYIWEMIF